MATTYYADNYYKPFPEVSDAAAQVIREFAYTIAAALVIADLIKLAPIKAMTGICLDDYYIDVPDLDSGGTPVVTLDLGDNTTADKFVAAATVGQSAGKLTPAVNGVAAAIPCIYTANNDLVLKIHAAPQTSTESAVIKGWMRYHLLGVGPVVF